MVLFKVGRYFIYLLTDNDHYSLLNHRTRMENRDLEAYYEEEMTMFFKSSIHLEKLHEFVLNKLRRSMVIEEPISWIEDLAHIKLPLYYRDGDPYKVVLRLSFSEGEWPEPQFLLSDKGKTLLKCDYDLIKDTKMHDFDVALRHTGVHEKNTELFLGCDFRDIARSVYRLAQAMTIVSHLGSFEQM